MKKTIAWPVIFFIGLLLIVGFFFVPYYRFITEEMKISPFKAVFSNDALKTFDNQVNILILGIAGQDHDGPNLSDSIIVANYNLKSNKLTTISIPRDIWSPTLRDKINSAYAYGEAKKANSGGFILSKSEVSAIVGIPVHYAAAIDFEKFEELIDFLGGIEVDVQRSFTDNKFPIKGKETDECSGDMEYKCRYETVTFRKGKTVMDGETALKFVRSRYADGAEGTDFARELRQQKVMTAVKDKVISYVRRPSIGRYAELYSLLNKLVKRDISNQQVAIMMRNAVLNRKLDLREISLSEDFFVNPDISGEYDYLWVLVPKTGDFNAIHNYIKGELKDEGKGN